MNNQNSDPWDFEMPTQDTIDIHKNKTEKDPWDQLDFDEGFWKNAFRTASQIPQAVAETTTPGLVTGLWHLLATGEAFDPEAIEDIRRISQREGIPFNEEEYTKAANDALGYIPTVSNLARMTEEKTGIPLEPKTKLQKSLRLGVGAGRLAPGTATQKTVAGITAPAISQTAQAGGVPEPLADILGLGASGITGAAAEKLPSPGIGKAQKPSGLTTRQFEKIKEPKSISEGRLGKINEKLESDFKGIAEDIFSKTPIEETRATLKESPEFKETIREQFKKVEELADDIPGFINTDIVKKRLQNRLKKAETGFALSEYEKEYNHFINKFIEETPSQEVRPVNLVKKFRETNKELSEYYDPGRSRGYNRAKKDALLETNRAIADVIETEFPNSEFSKIFPETNQQWSKIMDAEAISDFMEGLFEGKMNYKEAKKFFDNENLARPFKRSLGEEGFNNFQQLLKDLLETETPYKMLKIAKANGFGDLAKTASTYLISPKLGAARTIYKTAKGGYNAIMNALLDKPQIAITWKKGIDNIKKGKFQQAEKDFKTLDKEVQQSTKPEVKSTPSQKISKKENENIPSLEKRKEDAVITQKDKIKERIKKQKEIKKSAEQKLKNDPKSDLAKKIIDQSDKLIKNSEKLLDQLEKEGVELINPKEYQARSNQEKKKFEKPKKTKPLEAPKSGPKSPVKKLIKSKKISKEDIDKWVEEEKLKSAYMAEEFEKRNKKEKR